MKNDRSNELPKARQDQLIVKELPDEVLIYDLKRDKAHCLNSTAALVWKRCDGNSSVKEIAASLGDASKSVDDRIVWLALDQLKKFHLLKEAPAMPAFMTGLNRRELVRRIGIAAIAAPLILSIAAPVAQAAGSCLTNGGTCGSNNQCCSGRCCGSPGNPIGTPGCTAGNNNTCF
jgi:putative sterol carrier protein